MTEVIGHDRGLDNVSTAVRFDRPLHQPFLETRPCIEAWQLGYGHSDRVRWKAPAMNLSGCP